MRVAIIVLVFASALFLIQPSEAQPLGPSSLSGTVCIEAPWADCDEPLPGATVHVVGGGILGLAGSDEKATSAKDGSYVIDRLHDGEHEVTISRPGFKAQRLAVDISGGTKQDFVMQGEAVRVAGKVEGIQGEPIARAYVSMWGTQGWAEATTAADGTFAVDIQAGWYQVHVGAQDRRYLEQRVLVDGSDLVLAFEPLTGQDALVKGRVVDQHGDPVNEAVVMVSQWEARQADGSTMHGDFQNATKTDAEGRYEINVYRGSLSIEVRKAGHSSDYDWMYLDATQTVTKDFELMQYPPKTARLAGMVTDVSGQELPYIRISIELPEYGLHECSNRGSHPMPVAEPAYAEDIAYSGSARHHEPEPCAIHVDGGSFTGNVTPGYAVVHVRYDRWAACDETHHSDGSYERNCGPDYFAYTETVQLQPDEVNVLDITMEQRPGPDASISGYALDAKTGKAIPEAWIDFQHQDAQGWGSASTDRDGSYKVRLRSGYQQVHVWAEGYLPWQGVVKIAPGSEQPFDVELTQGESRYGGCCYRGHAMAHDSPANKGADEAMPATDRGGDYEDMGGGLGPYDAGTRAKVLSNTDEAKGIPNPVAFVVVGLAAAAMRRR